MKRIHQLTSILILALVLAGCNKKPEARFQTIAEGLTVAFEFIGDGDIESFEWDFGDGNGSAEMNPVHTFAQSGEYTITLKVSGDGGSDESSETISVSGSPAVEYGAAANPELHFADADGVMYAINVRSFVNAGGNVESTTHRMASAWFKKSGNKVGVGDVTWHQGSASQELEYDLDENDYAWEEDQMSNNNFKNSGVSWTIEGGNGFPNVGGTGLSNLYPFPSNKAITEEGASISDQAAYTLEISGNLNNADSVIFSIHGSNGMVEKRSGGSATSATFSAAEIQSVGKGVAVLQVAAANFYSDSSTGKKMYTINQSVVNYTLEID